MTRFFFASIISSGVLLFATFAASAQQELFFSCNGPNNQGLWACTDLELGTELQVRIINPALAEQFPSDAPLDGQSPELATVETPLSEERTTAWQWVSSTANSGVENIVRPAVNWTGNGVMEVRGWVGSGLIWLGEVIE